MDIKLKINKFIEYIKINNLGAIDINISFKDLTTLKIGGKIACYYLPKTIDDLVVSFKYIIKEGLPYYVIGKGSNILASDRNFDMIVINLKNICKIIQIDENKFIIGAGVNNSNFSYQMAKNGYTKIEFLSVIPGTIGGAIYMNAGAYNTSISDIIKDVTYLSQEGNMITLTKEELEFGYRKSIFKDNKGIILSTLIELPKAKNKDLPLEKIHTYKVRKKETQPLAVASAGSTFKNGVNYDAWKIIEDLGYRGYYNKDIMVSKMHTNYIINVGSAKYIDMIELIDKIKNEAKAKFNINLESEWEIIE